MTDNNRHDSQPGIPKRIMVVEDHPIFRLGLNENTGQVRFYTEQDNEVNTKFVTNEDYGDGEWHHVVATRDGNKAKIYVDGALVKEGDAMDGNIGGDDTNWYLAQDGNTNGYLIGAMDEVRIYNRALTEEEVKKNFDSEGGTRKFLCLCSIMSFFFIYRTAFLWVDMSRRCNSRTMHEN